MPFKCIYLISVLIYSHHPYCQCSGRLVPIFLTEEITLYDLTSLSEHNDTELSHIGHCLQIIRSMSITHMIVQTDEFLYQMMNWIS